MINLNGIQIVRSSLLPERTMYVSEDVYLMFTETQEERKARESAAIQSILDHSTRVQELNGKR